MNEMNSTTVTFIPRPEGGRYDLMIYRQDEDTIATLRIPITGPMDLEVKYGARYVPGSTRHSYVNTWLTFNVPPRYRYLSASMTQYYYLTYEQHPNIDCIRDAGFCYICSVRESNKSSVDVSY